MVKRKIWMVLVVLAVFFLVGSNKLYACTPTEYRCLGAGYNVLRVCDSNGQNWLDVYDCNVEGGRCSTTEKKCINTALKELGQVCSSGSECSSTLCYGGYCSKSCYVSSDCTDGFECKMVAGTSSASNKVCQKESSYSACEPGTYSCVAGSNGHAWLQKCNSTGTTWELEDCGIDGTCVVPSNGSTGKCVNNNFEIGAACSNNKDCASDYCFNGYCTTKNCRNSGCASGFTCLNYNTVNGRSVSIEWTCVKNGDIEAVNEIDTNPSSSSNSYDPTCTPASGGTGTSTALGCIPVEIKSFIPWLLGYLFGIAGGIAFLLMSYGFILVATSGGDEKKVAGAKETITSAIIGLLVCIFAIFILKLIAVNILNIPGF